MSVLTKIAIVQKSPVFLDSKKTIEKTIDNIEESAENGANIVAFAEGWISGYPAWIDHSLHFGRWDRKEFKDCWAKMYEDGLEINSNEIKAIKDICKEKNVFSVLGLNEVVKNGKGNGSIYNSLIIINNNGKLVVHHRKLMPTYNEKLIHAYGDGAGLKSIQTQFGNIGGLICWEHWMPLTR